ncbi:hypothetical protein C5E45_23665 [Nocardia nova]|uniref:IPT/TIG domain-containing protein n=1 Tax=Nocardia nova TaxID=37330 RepID=A0A2S6AKR6_9NOCA|nr:hypothetical protein C5E45_23665 [Nocardia nova]
MTGAVAGQPFPHVTTGGTPSHACSRLAFTDVGPAQGGNSVVITGSGFTGVGPLSVRFGPAATNFTVESDTRITTIAPPGKST